MLLARVFLGGLLQKFNTFFKEAQRGAAIEIDGEAADREAARLRTAGG